MKAMSMEETLRAIPSTNEILIEEEVKILIDRFGRNTVLDFIRSTLEDARSLIHAQPCLIEGRNLQDANDVKSFVMQLLNRRVKMNQLKDIKKIINATGIVLHTNLGRAPLPREAVDSMTKIGAGYCNLEFDLAEGGRGSRHAHLEEILTRLTGAEAGMIVNNNAAAVFLCLNTFANHKEVIVSRGEQVEIGGSFRIPDIISRSGSEMIEVGTTNKTYLSDYEQAISEKTSILLKVHTSNYKVTGFTEEVDIEEFTALGQKNNLLTMMDLGSGCMIPLPSIGIPYEPTVQDCVETGADLVTFSGDKLLGGPQAGIVVGKKRFIEELKRNPLSRMVRCDKLTIAALKKVLEIYLEPDEAIQKIPVLTMLALTKEQLRQKAELLQEELLHELGAAAQIEIDDVMDEVGGGSLPGTLLAGTAVSFKPDNIQINELQGRLRQAENPVVCRIFRDKLYFHLRTIEEQDFPILCTTVKNALREPI